MLPRGHPVTKASASVAPSRVIAAPIPSADSAAISVVFLPLLRGAAPTARCPRGARLVRGVMFVCIPLSSTSESASHSAAIARHAARAAMSRSVAISDFFHRPPDALLGAAQRALAHHPCLLFPPRAVLGEGRVRISNE